MKKLIILMAFAGLVTACHKGEYRGGAGTETGTYQGTTGAEGWSGSMTNTNKVFIPEQQQPGGPSSPGKTGAGGVGGSNTQTGPSGTGTSDQNTQPSDQDTQPQGGSGTGTDTGPGGGGTDTGTGENGAGVGGY